MVSQGRPAPSEPDGPVPAVVTGVGEAFEASVEGVPGALSMVPTAAAPSLGAELLLGPDSQAAGGAEAAPAVTPETVRSGLAQAGPLAAAGLVANAANAVVGILVARLLDNQGYGTLAQLTGLFLVVSMPGSAVTVAVVRRVTGWSGAESAGTVRRWAVRLHARGTLALFVFSLLVVAFRHQIGSLLSSPSPSGATAMLVAGAVWVLLSLDRGLLQAHREYRTLAANLLVEGAGRVVFTLCLVGAGLGVAGAAAGVLIAEVVTAVHARITADRVWAVGSNFAPADPGRLRRWWAQAWRTASPMPKGSVERSGIVADLLVALPSLALIALLQNVDVIVLVRDNPHASGVYAAISVISKAVVFAAVAVGGYLLPEAAIRWHEGHHALKQLAVSLLLLAVPALALLVAAVVAPHLLLSVVFTARYAGASGSLVTLVLAMVCLSITVILTMYLLAVGCRWIVAVLLAGAGVAVAAVAAAHGNPAATADADLAVQAALALAVSVGFVAVHWRRVRGPRSAATHGRGAAGFALDA